jgi:hypothetical protein
MSNKKALRAQRHLSQPITVDGNQNEVLPNKKEIFEQTKAGLKKKVMYNGAKYAIAMEKE